ncbi:hypothetical protein D3C72_1110310 [compost metagenome]
MAPERVKTHVFALLRPQVQSAGVAEHAAVIEIAQVVEDGGAPRPAQFRIGFVIEDGAGRNARRRRLRGQARVDAVRRAQVVRHLQRHALARRIIVIAESGNRIERHFGLTGCEQARRVQPQLLQVRHTAAQAFAHLGKAQDQPG